MKKMNVIKCLLMISTIIFSFPTFAQANDTDNTATTNHAPQQINIPLTDSSIASNIQSELDANTTTLKGSSIRASSTGGVIILDGTVHNKAQADEAIRVAKSVRGVKEVKSNLRVVKNPTTP